MKGGVAWPSHEQEKRCTGQGNKTIRQRKETKRWPPRQDLCFSLWRFPMGFCWYIWRIAEAGERPCGLWLVLSWSWESPCFRWGSVTHVGTPGCSGKARPSPLPRSHISLGEAKGSISSFSEMNGWVLKTGLIQEAVIPICSLLSLFDISSM